MQTALVGLAGLLIGVFVTEYFRKKSRAEQFSAQIFEKRLIVYEKLMKEFQLACGVIDALFEEKDESLDESYEIAFRNGLKLLQFTDENEFYLNEEVTVHIGMLFVGTGNIFLSDVVEQERQDAYDEFRSKVGETKRLIKSASGISAIDELINKITDSKPQSDYITQFRRMKKEYEKKVT